jgi:uridine phosphorylase
VASGTGTPSTEIIINELIILNEIDLNTRQRRKTPLHKNLNIIRLGTCGGLQKTTELGSFVITKYVLGLDNTGLFYSSENSVDEKLIKLENMAKEKLDEAIDKKSRFYNAIRPYAAAASPEVVQALYEAATEENAPAVKGITISSSGFFANQGRDISRITPTVPDIDEIFSEIAIDDVKAENMEMETSFLCHFVGALGYRIGSICLTLAHRPTNSFYYGDYEERILTSLKIVLRAFEKLSRS